MSGRVVIHVPCDSPAPELPPLSRSVAGNGVHASGYANGAMNGGLKEVALTTVNATAVGLDDPRKGPSGRWDDSDADASGSAEEKKAAADKAAVEKKKAAAAAEERKVPYFQLFRYADGWDYLMLALGTVGSIGAGAAWPVFSVIFGELLDAISPATPLDDIGSEVAKFATYMVILAAAMFVCGFLAFACWIWTAERQTRRLREAYLRAILRKPVSWFDARSAGGVTATLAADTKKVGDAIGEKVSMAIMNFAMFFSGVIIGLVYGWQLTLVVLSVTPLLGFAGYMYVQWRTRQSLSLSFRAVCACSMMVQIEALTQQSTAAYSQAGAIADEAISNVRTVQSFGGEKREAARYSVKLLEAMHVGIRSALVNGATMGVTMLIMFGSYGLAMWYGAKLVYDGTNSNTGSPYTGGDVLAVFFAVLMGGMGLGQAFPSLPVMATGQAAAVDLFAAIDSASSIDAMSDAGVRLKRADGSEGVTGRIELRGVHFAYPSNPTKRILNGLNLTISRGEKVALVGASGCGKSTLVSLIERFYDPLPVDAPHGGGGGEVLIDGVDLKTINVKWWRDRVGLVQQEPVLFGGSIKDNIASGKPGATDEEVMAAAKAANCHLFITALPDGYTTLVGDRGKLLSGGEKQRIAIARAILKNPPILLLDEATSALDTQNEKEVQVALDALMAQRTTIIVAHRLSTVRDADRIFVLGGGQVLESGSHNQLLAIPNGHYSRLVQSQEQQRNSNGESKDDSKDERKTMAALRTAYIAKSKAAKEKAAAASASGGVGADAKAVVATSSNGEAKAEKMKESDPAIEKEMAEREARATADPSKNITLGRVFSYSQTTSEKLWFALGVFASILNGTTYPLFSLVFSEMIVVYYKPRDEMMDGAAIYSGLLAALGGFIFVIQTLTFWSLGVVAERLTYTLRHDTFRSVLRQDISFFDDKRNSTGILLTKLATDAAAVHGLASSQVPKTIQIATTLVCGLIIALVEGWKLALVVIAILPLLIFAGALQWQAMGGFSQAGKTAYEGAGKVAHEALTNIRTVASFTREQHFVDRFTHQMEGVVSTGLKSGAVAGVGFAFSNFVLFASYSLAFWYGAILIKADEMTFDQVLRVFFAIVMAAMGVGETSTYAPNASKAQLSANAIFELIDRKPAIDTDLVEREPAVAAALSIKPASFASGGVVFRDVQFHYPTRPDVNVFAGLNLRIAPKTTVALVGASGSGKSTIIQLLQRFYDPVTPAPTPAPAAIVAPAVAAAAAVAVGGKSAADGKGTGEGSVDPRLAGEIIIDGESMRGMDVRSLRSRIGVVSQEPNLFSGSIADNIRFGAPDATDAEVIDAARQANIHDFIMSLKRGYQTRIGPGMTSADAAADATAATAGAAGVQLSGGIAIARAIIRRPTILLLDEATSALDSKSERIVQSALDNVMRGRTTIVVAHRLSTIRHADTIVVLERGAIKEMGTHQQLMTNANGIYAQLSALSSLDADEQTAAEPNK